MLFVGPASELQHHAIRRAGAMRIDAAGCSVFASTAPLTAGAPLDVVIAKGEAGAAMVPASEAIRMEIAGGKIVRWEQEIPSPGA